MGDGRGGNLDLYCDQDTRPGEHPCFFFASSDLNLPKISHKSRSDYGLRKLAGSLGWRIALLLSRSFRRLAIPAALSAVVLTASAQAQQSNGLTFYHLADSAAKDTNGNLFGNIKGGSQTDGKVVAFTSASTTNTCDPSTHALHRSHHRRHRLHAHGAGPQGGIAGTQRHHHRSLRATRTRRLHSSSTRLTTLPPAARSVAVSSKFRSRAAPAPTLWSSGIP